MKLIPYGRQHITIDDISKVVSVLKQDVITTGLTVQKFEKKINNFLKCKYSTVCNSGTSALFIAFQSINIKKGDVVIMPSINFVASYNIAKLFGAKIFLSDVDKYTGQMSPENIHDCCKKFNLKKIKAIVVMYNGGYPDNSEKFNLLKKKYKCYLIEDACHAFGSTYKFKSKNYKIGSCKHSDIATFSLHPLKTITTGEGGIVTTNDKKLDQKIKIIRSLGIKKNKKKHWDYDVVENGFNFRLTDFQCALGISQLSKIDYFIKRRKKIADKYIEALKKINSIIIPKYKNKYLSSHHLFLINLKENKLKIKEKFIKFMLKNKILIQYHYIPIYKFKNFKGKFLKKNSEIYYKNCLSLPIYVNLTKKEQEYIISKIITFFK